MAPISVKHVVSCSSEDTAHKADNLLKGETYRKWKSASPGERSISVILQFEKASQISSIDIGNEGSAFIEVLVGKSASESDMQVILVSSSFMSPIESKNNSNLNRVRMFGSDKLTNTVKDQKWDRVKIVCSQPFNKHITYGLSFIKFHSSSSPHNGATDGGESSKKLGAFKLRDEPSSKISPGSLFKAEKVKKVDDAVPLKGAAAVRAAVHTPSTSTETSTPKANKRRHSSEDDKRRDTPVQKKMMQTPTSSHKNREEKPPMKRTKSEPSKASKTPTRKFSELMENVVFVLSGYQNPKRGTIRDKALSMGATYKPDWGPGCTHLVCAFANTPKFNQVKKKGGKIVTARWVLDSCKQQTLLPWRKYELGDPDSDSSTDDEDDDEDDDDDYAPVTKRTKASPAKPSKVKQKASPSPSPVKKEQHDRDMYDDSTDEEIVSEVKGHPSDGSSDSDTEDEIERVRQQSSQQKKTDNNDDDLYGGSTDEESDVPDLPNLFTKTCFFLYGSFTAKERHLLTRLITAYNGSLEEYMTDKVQYVITNSNWDNNFNQALTDNSSLVFVKPTWIYKCDESQKRVPYQRFVIVP